MLFAIPLFMLTSSYVSKIDINFNKVFKISISLIILSIIIFNFRNILRINHESKIYGYDIKSSPFFYIDEISSELVYEKDNFRFLQQLIINNVGHQKRPVLITKI